METLSKIVTGRGEVLHFNAATFRRLVDERGKLINTLHNVLLICDARATLTARINDCRRQASAALREI